MGVAGIRTLDGSMRFSISAIAWLTASSWNRQFLSVSTAYISSKPKLFQLGHQSLAVLSQDSGLYLFSGGLFDTMSCADQFCHNGF